MTRKNLISSLILVLSLSLGPGAIGSMALAQGISQAVLAQVQSSSSLSEEAKAYYKATSYKPIWFGNRSQSRRKALLAAIRRAGNQGLPQASYHRDKLKNSFRGASGTVAKAQAEVLATAVFLKYARDLSSGVLEPSQVDHELAISPPRRGDGAMLAAFAKTNPRKFLAALAPLNPEYKKLLAEKARLEKAMGSGGWGNKVPVNTMKPGALGNGVVAMRARLGRMGYGRLGGGGTYETNLVKAVQRFQQDHGLNPDGVAGPGTLKVMNIEPEQRLQQVLVNLERQRWMNFNRGKRHIYVNLAAFKVDVIDNGRSTYTSRTVVGKANRDRTPEFHDQMTHMVVNPTWHVPRSIAGKEYLPILRKDPSFLRRRNMVMINSAGKAVNPANVNLSRYSARNFPYAIKQRPGRGNALGQVKFMFPNKYNIYLHDTPSKSLFNRELRAFSHGCVRVQKPFDLAYMLLSRQTSNPKGAFQGWLKTGREQYVDLAKPVPVYLSYNTVFFGDGKRPNYRADIYGRDRKVFKALNKAGVALRAVQG